MENIKGLWFLFLICGVFVFLPYRATFAGEDSMYFDNIEKYDVQFQVNEKESNVIKNVRIEEICTMGERKYLVINLQQNLQKNRGYVLFDSIRSILPSGRYVVKITDSGM